MKIAVVLLLLANFGFYAWQYDHRLHERVSRARLVSAPPAGTPSLKLVRELDRVPVLRDPPENTGPGGSEPAAEALRAPEAVADAAPGPAIDGAAPPAPAVAPGPDMPEGSVADLTGGPPSAPPDATVPVPAEAADITPADTQDATGVCINAGPFPTLADAAGLQSWLGGRATAVEVRTETVRKRELFWVYLEAATREAAQQDIADLQRKGVRDYLLIRRGGLDNAISLGLFSSQDSVNRRLAEMNRQGYKPVVVPRFETTDRQWIRARLGPGYEDFTRVPGDLLGHAKLAEIGCGEIAAHGVPP